MIPATGLTFNCERDTALIFLPPIRGEMDFGGVLYLNHITHTHVSTFDDGSAQGLCSVTAFGLEHIEYALENHLLRPKADRLAFAPDDLAR